MKTLLLNTQQIEELKRKYSTHLIFDKNQYIAFHIKSELLNLTLYTSNSCVIKKDLCSYYQTIIIKRNQTPILGCDETGVGDILLPVVATAVYLDQKTLLTIIQSDFNINDSKKLTDKQIIAIFNYFQDKVKYSTTIIPNEQYNKMITKGYNSHSIKTYVHLKNIQQFDSKINVILDQYVKKSNFDKYASELKIKTNHKILFETKADSKYVSVALASIFARYTLIQEKFKLEKKMQMNIPYGANNEVVKVCEKIKNTQNKIILNTIVKAHFKNIANLL